MAKLYVFGCGGHARSVADIYLNCNPGNEVIFIDSNAYAGESIFSFPVIKELEEEVHLNESIFIALGNNKQRKDFYSQFYSYNIQSIISSKAYIGNAAIIGRGCFVGNFCHIGPEAIIGENTIINTGAIIEHEVNIGKHSHIAPNATISGRTVIGDEVFIGASATVIDKITIGNNVIVGAGSTVIKNITEPGTYVGSPALRIK